VLKKLGLLWLIGIILLGLGYVNMAVYPFATSRPNYSDVERVFNKMQFPGDWQEIRSSENRGIAGRACPIESESACYHKSKTFKVPDTTQKNIIEAVLNSAGCQAVSFTDSTPSDGDPSTNYACSAEGLSIRGTLYKKPLGWEASVTTYSR